MAVIIAGASVMVWPSRMRTGTRILGLMARRDSGAASVFVMALMNVVVKGRAVSWRRMCGAREQAPGARTRLRVGDGIVGW